MSTTQDTTNTNTVETQQPINYNLNLENVPYNTNHSLIAGSLGQLMKSIQDLSSRISSDKETDDYKKALYPKLRNISTGLLDQFFPLLKANNSKEEGVRKFNIIGYNGMVKKVRGRFPFVARLRPNTTYKYANFGDLMKVVKQRCEYLTTREVPQRYIDDHEEGQAFTKLRGEVATFLNYLNNTVDKQWSDAVTSARTAGGQLVQQNLERRNTEKEVTQNSGQEETKFKFRKFKKQRGGYGARRDNL
jgi:hypothetical protein